MTDLCDTLTSAQDSDLKAGIIELAVDESGWFVATRDKEAGRGRSPRLAIEAMKHDGPVRAH